MDLSPEVLAWMQKLNNNKSLGPGTVVRAVDMVVPQRFTSGCLSLDVALGGGWPGNQFVEIIGPESSGKSCIALKTVAANQRLRPDFTTFWLAAEHYDTDQATALGVDNERVIVAPTQKLELGLEFLDDALESQAFDCLVLDSFPALLPDLEAEKGMDEATVAVGAKVFNKFWRKAGASGRRNPDGSERAYLGIVVNQWRDRIGTFQKFGVPLTSPGGHGKDYAFYVRLKVARDKFIVEKRPPLPEPVVVGQVISVKTIKNKCLAEGTGVLDASTGAWVPIEKMRPGQWVWSVNDAGRMEKQEVTGVLDQGVQQLHRVTMSDGTSFRATATHPFLTPGGWMELGQIFDQPVARPRLLPGNWSVEESRRDEEDSFILGLLLGDGCITGDTEMMFINTDDANVSAFRRLVEARGCSVRLKPGHEITYSFSHRPAEKNQVLGIVKQSGNYGCRSWEKTLPPYYFCDSVSSGEAGALLSGLWETDGSVGKGHTNPRASYFTSSRTLAEQVKTLLLRFGITSALYTRDNRGRQSVLENGHVITTRRLGYEVRIQSRDLMQRLLDTSGFWTTRGNTLKVKLEALSGSRTRKTSRSQYITAEQTEEVLTVLRGLHVTPSAVKAIVYGHGRGSSRTLASVIGKPLAQLKVVRRLAEVLGDPVLRRIADQDVYYRQITSILPAGAARTYDLTVSGYHNFVAADTIVHNSASPQQTAKVDFYFRNAPFTGFHRGDYDLGKDYVAMGVLFGVIQKNRSWCHFAGEKWISEDAMAEALRQDKGLQEKLAAEVLEVASDPRRVDDIARETAEKPDSGTTTRRRRK